jgi:hypothetical protein
MATCGFLVMAHGNFRIPQQIAPITTRLQRHQRGITNASQIYLNLKVDV